MNDDKLMNDAEYWLLHPEIHYQTLTRQFEFIARVVRHWKIYKKISLKQRRYVIYVLNKHTK